MLVYGVTGSGKTTAAARISEATGIPWTAVDDQTHEADWVVVPEDMQRHRFAEICAGDSWLLDSAYGAWLDVVLLRAELIVALDYPRWVSLRRLVRRSLARAWDKQLICNGNTETWRQLFSPDSIVVWHFKSFARKRQRIRDWSAQPGGPRVLRFTTSAALDAWVDSLQACRSAGSTGSERA